MASPEMLEPMGGVGVEAAARSREPLTVVGDERAAILPLNAGARRRPAIARAHGRVLGSAVLALTDTAAVVVSMALAASWSPAGVGYALATLLVLAASGRWHVRITLRALDGVPRLVGKLAVPLLLLAPLAAGPGIPAVLFRQALVTPLAVVVGRGVAFAALRHLRRQGVLREKVLIIGGGSVAGDLARALHVRRDLGLDPVGHLDPGPPTLPVPRLGDVEDLDAVVRGHGVGRLLVAFSTTREHDMVEVLRTAILHRLDIYVVPRFFDVVPGHRGVDTDEVWGIPLYRMRPLAFDRPAWSAKRAMDVVLAGTGLLIAAPLLTGIALTLRFADPGPVLFRQRRVGQFGREFDVLKFRTMRVNDEADTRWGGSEDPRVTKIGRLLRRTNLDELPQLWNIVRGDMSLIGPRPERPYFAQLFGESIPGYGARHRFPAGLTGWAQVNGLRGDTSIEERARFDNSYIEQWSLWRDAVILMRTVSAALRRGSS